jgi:hypothetical protein
MQAIKIGQLDAQISWLPKLRSWHRWQPAMPLENEPTKILSDYLSLKLDMDIPPANDLAAAQRLLTILIDEQVITT